MEDTGICRFLKQAVPDDDNIQTVTLQVSVWGEVEGHCSQVTMKLVFWTTDHYKLLKAPWWQGIFLLHLLLNPQHLE